MAASNTNQFFVPGFGISRIVIQKQIQYHCGPGAIVRPYTLQGRDGYLVSSQGPPLTTAQIEDLKEASIQFEKQQAGQAVWVSHGEAKSR